MNIFPFVYPKSFKISTSLVYCPMYIHNSLRKEGHSFQILLTIWKTLNLFPSNVSDTAFHDKKFDNRLNSFPLMWATQLLSSHTGGYAFICSILSKHITADNTLLLNRDSFSYKLLNWTRLTNWCNGSLW